MCSRSNISPPSFSSWGLPPKQYFQITLRKVYHHDRSLMPEVSLKRYVEKAKRFLCLIPQRPRRVSRVKKVLRDIIPQCEGRQIPFDDWQKRPNVTLIFAIFMLSGWSFLSFSKIEFISNDFVVCILPTNLIPSHLKFFIVCSL